MPGVRYVDSVLIAAATPDGSVVASIDPVPIAGLQLPAATGLRQQRPGRGPGLAHRQPASPPHPARSPSPSSRRPADPMDVQGSQFHLLHGAADWGSCTDWPTGLRLGTAWDRGSGGTHRRSVHSSLEYDQASGPCGSATTCPCSAGPDGRSRSTLRPGGGPDATATATGTGSATTRPRIDWRPVDDVVSAPWWSAAELGAVLRRGPVDLGVFVPAARRHAPSTWCWPAWPSPPTTTWSSGTRRPRSRACCCSTCRPAVRRCACCGRPLRAVRPGRHAGRRRCSSSTGTTPPTSASTSTSGSGARSASDQARSARSAGGPPERHRGHGHPGGQPALRRLAARHRSTPSASSPAPGRAPPSSSTRTRRGVTRSSTSSTPTGCAGRRPWPTPSRSSTPRPDRHPAAVLAPRPSTSAYLVAPPATGPLPPPMLYIADAEGKQVVAFTARPGDRRLGPSPTSCRCGAGTARPWCAPGGGAWYDFGDRWVPLEVFTECRSSPPAPSPRRSTSPSLPGQPFDSQLPGCVWHRLLLDAQVPTGTGLAVRARAADDPALLVQSPWLPQPDALPALRRRRAGLVRPVGRPAGGRRLAARRHRHLRAPRSSRSPGRYLQVQLTLQRRGPLEPRPSARCGPGTRGSPTPSTTCPPSTAEDAAPYGFLERFLANFEGFLHDDRGAHRALEPAARRPHRHRSTTWPGWPAGSGWCSTRSGTRPSSASWSATSTTSTGAGARLAGLLAILPVYLEPERGRLGLRLRLRQHRRACASSSSS